MEDIYLVNKIKVLENQLKSKELYEKKLREQFETLRNQITQLADLSKIIKRSRFEKVKHTKVFLSKKIVNKILKEWNKALTTPVIKLRSDLPDMASTARNLVVNKINKIAQKKGLPKSGENYGIDPESGEILSLG